MNNFKKSVMVGTLIAILSGCGTEDMYVQNVNAHTAVIENNSGWETLEVISNRPIIAKLEQTDKKSSQRDKEIEKIKESNEFKEGLFGEPTQELAESLSIQQVEGSIVIPELIEVYGGHAAFNKEGVIFFENQSQGAEQSGLWIGIKAPDERLHTFIDKMQKKVDAGEIRAEYIFIYYTPYTTYENEQLSNQVVSEVQKIVKQNEALKRGSFGINVDTITGHINIDHNFLTEDLQQKLVQLFKDRNVNFIQSGPMIPKEGESDIINPSSTYTEQLTKEGSYVLEVSKDKILVIDAQSMNYGQTGGDSEYFSAIYYQFPHSSDKLRVGQRVKVVPSGPILESYPGQGSASFVEILPEYKPPAAELSESHVVARAIEKANEHSHVGILAIRQINYDEELDEWTIQFKPSDGDSFEVQVEDK
ncbi:DUF3221 domain-containing protein [Bacillus salitolerans]|uniref:DUF3221 domain-containing protein n=1 Tax=Bacillus salitolerans TaxID=1437434 RepID=A0ABW4LMJ4_9BACI